MRLTQIALGHDHVCGLNEGARAICVEDLRGLTFQPASLSSISSGKFYFCGLGYGGAVSCWGQENPYGEASPPPGAFSSVSAGKRHACALDADGEAVCWGWDKGGRATPPADARFIAVAAGGAHTCGIAEFGNLICWGDDRLGRSDPREGPFSALALGLNHTCALKPDGRAFCQGGDGYGQSSPPPTVFSSISDGESQTCGITPQGGLECWGLMSISGYPDKFAFVSVGYREICALTIDGAVKCWVNSPPGEDPINGVLDHPVEMFPMPFGGVAVADRRGHISLYPPEGGAPRIALDLTERTSFVSYTERGLQSAALDPDFDRFPFIYIYWQTSEGVADPAYPFEGRVSRFPVADDGSVSEDDELVILRLGQKKSGHFGGALRFGPDGMLYLGLGDQDWKSALAKALDGIHPSVDLSSLLGKIIRIDVRGATESAPYRAPPDNPFVDTPGARPEIWAYGLRNPWRMSFAPGGELIVADPGLDSREEVSIVTRGANMGWPLFEGGMCFAADKRLCEDAEGYTTLPIFEYTHEEGGCAIVGGMSAPDGRYIFGDYCSGRIRALEETAPGVWEASEITEALGGVYPLGNVLAFGSDEDGAVYALKLRSPVWKASE